LDSGMTNSPEQPEHPPPAPLDPVMAEFAVRLDAIVAHERALHSMAARRVELLDDLRRYSETAVVASLTAADPADVGDPGPHGWDAATVARRELVFELSAALRIPERTIEGLLEEAQALVAVLPATLGALRDGDVSFRHATVMLDQALSLPEPARAGFEEALLPHAKELTVGKFRRRAVSSRERLHPVSITERHTAAMEERRVWVECREDGMADLTARLSAEVALAAYARLTDIAKGQTGPDDTRQLGQKRADAYADLLLCGDTCAAGDEPLLSGVTAGAGNAGVGHGIRPEVAVTVPVLTLLGLDQEPGELTGYGPIDPETARRLAERAPSFMRILTHPVTSAILDVDRERYRVPADLRAALRLRDGTCRTVGCNTPASRSDVDHTVARKDGGLTRVGNLSHHCPQHHRFKHHTRVRMRNLPGGEIEMTTPSGKVYVTRPENPFQRPRA
jgi:hypothetical protein